MGLDFDLLLGCLTFGGSVLQQRKHFHPRGCGKTKPKNLKGAGLARRLIYWILTFLDKVNTLLSGMSCVD